MSSVKISVIGCGHWGKNLVRNFEKIGALSAVCDVNRDLAQTMAKQYEVPYLNLDQILQSKTDGIVIAAPASQHYDLAYRALQARKHVFVEKPLSLTLEESETLCHVSRQMNCTLMVGHLLQYHPAFLALKALISSAALGRLQYIYSTRLNLGRFRKVENILWSFAPHDISMILQIADTLPETVYATGGCYLNSSIHDVTTTSLSFKNGLNAHIFVSWLHPYKEQKLVVIGDQGMAVFDDCLSWQEKLTLYPHRVSWTDGLPQPEKASAVHIPLEAAEPLTLECQHFIDCIEKDDTPRTDGEEGKRVLTVLTAAEESLHTQKPVFLQKKSDPYFAQDTARIDTGCTIGSGTKIWHFSHILKGTSIGHDCVIGQNVMIGPDVRVGNHCKIQNNVSLYRGIALGNGVFCGPSCVFTNVLTPRAEINRKHEFLKTIVEHGVTIGANATIVCGRRLGSYSLIGAGAVVTKNVKPHALVVGNPARQIGWVSHAGERLRNDFICPREGRRYQVNTAGELEEVPQAEEKEEKIKSLAEREGFEPSIRY